MAPESSESKQEEEEPWAESAMRLHGELIRDLAAKREVHEKKALETQAAKSAHASALIRIKMLEEQTKLEVTRLQIALSSAEQAKQECMAESSRMKASQTNFMELQEASADKAKKGAEVLKSQLKFLGVEKKVMDAFPQILAKRRRTQPDKKVLGVIEEAFAMHLRLKAGALSKFEAEVQQCRDAVATASSATQTRAGELSGFADALKSKEAEKAACEAAVSRAASSLADHEMRMQQEHLMRFNSVGETCAVCVEDLPAEKLVKLGCGHGWYCLECMNRFVESRVQDGNAGAIPCPDCGDPIPEKDLVVVLPKTTIFKLHARSIEKTAVASGGVIRSCPTPNCPMRQTFKDGQSGCFMCPMCSNESCWLCSVTPYHEGKTCEQYARRQRKRGLNKDDESFFEWMEATGTRQCPKCQMATTKENLERQTEQRSECHKMLCRNCGTKFCFKCLAILTDTYTCGCTKNKHGFIDPHTGEIVKHLQRGKAKAKAKAGTVVNSGGG